MFNTVIQGKVWKFGDHISTDYLMPGPMSFSEEETLEERAALCMRPIRPEFAREVRPGDVIVAGRNFGCGSSRSASQNLVTLGVGCVVAESFSRIFFRNSVNLALPILSCKGISDAFVEGDVLWANFETAEVKNLTNGKVLQAEPLPEIAMRILAGGGIMVLLEKEYKSSGK